MRLLVMGGTVFLSKAVADEAVRRGHEVTCACRGTSGSVPEGTRLVAWDRDQPVPAELGGGVEGSRRRGAPPVAGALGGGVPE